ncbi:hypothetical protein NP233_g12117 [Leucocoprinus birnbaumii]|uniref:Uncharacterized protein n=1 Tax=Leucocoprinus birnbaumii TaxID=56174 RepID=A0AAD5YJR3_9AGAR|nr:hypothetical protein NP233_g12117 [Leucocoprinus birnbaumii]
MPSELPHGTDPAKLARAVASVPGQKRGIFRPSVKLSSNARKEVSSLTFRNRYETPSSHDILLFGLAAVIKLFSSDRDRTTAAEAPDVFQEGSIPFIAYIPFNTAHEVARTDGNCQMIGARPSSDSSFQLLLWEPKSDRFRNLECNCVEACRRKFEDPLASPANHLGMESPIQRARSDQHSTDSSGIFWASQDRVLLRSTGYKLVASPQNGAPHAEVAHGPMLLGVVFNVLLYGIMITQIYLYYTTYKRYVLSAVK